MSKSTNVAIHRAGSLFGCTRSLLYVVLMVGLQRVAQAGKLYNTTTAAGPNKEPRVTGEETSDVSGVRLELNVSGRVLKIVSLYCVFLKRLCRGAFFLFTLAPLIDRAPCENCWVLFMLFVGEGDLFVCGFFFFFFFFL